MLEHFGSILVLGVCPLLFTTTYPDIVHKKILFAVICFLPDV